MVKTYVCKTIPSLTYMRDRQFTPLSDGGFLKVELKQDSNNSDPFIEERIL